MEKKEKMKSKENMPKAEITPEGRYKCRRDSMEYDTKEDYEAHCKEDHSDERENEDEKGW